MTNAPFLTIFTAAIWLELAFPVCGRSLELWVSPSGSDQYNGSQKSPLASLSVAFAKGTHLPHKVDTSETDVLRIILHDGIYQMTEPLVLKPENFTSDIRTIRFEAAPNEHPVLSGGVPVQSWKKLTGEVPGLPQNAKDNIWVADEPRLGGRTLEFRQLWVNGSKAIRAREPNGENLARLIAWDKSQQVATVSVATLAGLQEPGRLEMVVDQVWEIAELRVASIRCQSTNAFLTFKPPESNLEFQHPWPPVIMTTNYHAPFFLVNAIQFIDEPGEWFEDINAGKIYYWPRAGEDLTHAQVIAPALETLVQISGTSEHPTAHVHFKGITFAHTTWLRPSEQGHVPLQAGMFLLAAKKLAPKGTAYHPSLDNLAWIGRTPAAVAVKNAHHITFENCTFEHLASAGLDFSSGTHDDLIQGNTFRDLGGNALQIGMFSDPQIETHLPYHPADENELCKREIIANNVITDCANEDWGGVGIAVGYARNVSITHNEVFNLPYTGISLGWGWTKMTNALRDNFIFANRVHHVGQRLGDLGGIYTLSAQPGTVVAENSISDIQPNPFVPDPQHWFYLYLDEGSAGMLVRDNWCPTEKFLKNANGPGNIWTNNGPQVSKKIKNAAGLEPAYRGLLKLYSLKTP